MMELNNFNLLVNRASRSFIAIAASLLVPIAHSSEVDTSDWVCEFCPVESGTGGHYAVGATNVSDDSAYFGNATGYDEAGTYLNVDGDGRYQSDGYQMRWTLEDLALDSRFAEITGGRQGTYDYHVSYRQIPRRVFDTTQTIFNPASADTLAVPSGWVTAPLASGFTELGSSLMPRNIDSDRKIAALGGRYMFSNHFRISVEFRRQQRVGTEVFAGSYFTQSSLLPGQFEEGTEQRECRIV